MISRAWISPASVIPPTLNDKRFYSFLPGVPVTISIRCPICHWDQHKYFHPLHSEYWQPNSSGCAYRYLQLGASTTCIERRLADKICNTTYNDKLTKLGSHLAHEPESYKDSNLSKHCFVGALGDRIHRTRNLTVKRQQYVANFT